MKKQETDQGIQINKYISNDFVPGARQINWWKTQG